MNGHQVISQWAQTNDRASDGTDNNNIDDTADQTVTGQVPNGRSYTKYVYKDSSNNSVVMEKYMVDGMGHAWSGGNSAGSYTDPQGPKASQIMWEFFQNHPRSGSGGGGGTAVVISNNGSKDGYVKAYSNGTGREVGTFSNLGVGAGGDGKQNRAILHFDTSGIPDDATITRAYLQVEYSSGSGDPWTGGTLVVDVKPGYFGSSDSVQTDDWDAVATASSVASIDRFTSGIKNSSDFNSAGLSAINKAGTTQVRLRFNWDPSAWNYIFIKEGSTAKLYVEYQ